VSPKDTSAQDFSWILDIARQYVRDVQSESTRQRLETNLKMFSEIMSGSVSHHALADSHDQQKLHVDVYRPWAFCSNCLKIQPVHPFSFTAPNQWTDVVCGQCGFTIATLYTGPLDGSTPVIPR
jgi:hypothetical protein